LDIFNKNVKVLSNKCVIFQTLAQEEIFIKFIKKIPLPDLTVHSKLHCYQYWNFNSACSQVLVFQCLQWWISKLC